MVSTLTPMRRLAVVLACTLAIMIGISPTSSITPAEASAGCLPSVVKQRLADIRSKFGPVRILSAYRKGARIAGTRRPSYHASCRAVDFVPPSGKYAAVAAWLKANHSGGVGTYSCGMSHIHIDNGPHVRFHKCAGGRHRHAKRQSRNRSYASKSRRSTVASRAGTQRTGKRNELAGRATPRGAGGDRTASRAGPKRLAEPKKFHLDINGYTLVN